VHASWANELHQQALALQDPSPSPAPTKMRKGFKPALDGDDIMAILDWIKYNPALTLKKIATCTQTELNKKVSKSILKHLIFPTKRW